MAERRTFTVEIYEDTGEVKEVIPPDGAKAVRGRLPAEPMKEVRITSIVIPIEVLKSNPARTCVHSRDCRYWCW